MGYAAGELTKGFHLLSLRKLLVSTLQRFLRVAPFCDITCNLCEPDQVAGFVVNCVDNHGRPEQCPVLASPPRLGFEPAGGSGNRERPVRSPVFSVLSRVARTAQSDADLFHSVDSDAR